MFPSWIVCLAVIAVVLLADSGSSVLLLKMWFPIRISAPILFGYIVWRCSRNISFQARSDEGYEATFWNSARFNRSKENLEQKSGVILSAIEVTDFLVWS